MKPTFAFKQASQDEIVLFCFMGEALCKTQIVEQALSHSITLKMNSSVTKETADEFLNQQLSYTLGKAIKLAKKENLYSASLQEDLNSFLELRNWLVHKAMSESQSGLSIDPKKNNLFGKLKSISELALSLQHAIELDLIHFCESKGRDMSSARAILNARILREQ